MAGRRSFAIPAIRPETIGPNSDVILSMANANDSKRRKRIVYTNIVCFDWRAESTRTVKKRKQLIEVATAKAIRVQAQAGYCRPDS
jgi:hypothetical protein